MDTTRAPSRPPRTLLLALATSAASLIAAAWWLAQPAANQFVPQGSAVLRAVLSPGQTAAVLLALGLLGTVLSAAALAPAARSRVGAPAALLSLATLGVLGLPVLAYTGYLLALVLPAILLFVVVQVARRGGAQRWLAVGTAAIVLCAFGAAGLLSADALVIMTKVLASVGDSLPAILSAYLILALAGSWALVAIRSARDSALGAWTLRHRRVLTVIAALGPAPYALTRLSWLTPWPLFAPDDLPPETRLWGLLLSGGAWAGIALTVGLIRPWGEVFPRWMPAVAGREVPVWCAAAPGGFVAAAVCAAALPMIMSLGSADGAGWIVVYALIMPFWAWGPALGLAVWGYVLHRRAAMPSPGPERQELVRFSDPGNRLVRRDVIALDAPSRGSVTDIRETS